jgi:hypothetical protein
MQGGLRQGPDRLTETEKNAEPKSAENPCAEY